MESRSSSRQRPLFHDGPSWHQLDEEIRQQVVERLAAVCHGILTGPAYPAINQQEQSDAERDD